MPAVQAGQAGPPIYQLRLRRLAKMLFLGAAMGAGCFLVASRIRRHEKKPSATCHPNLAHLRGKDGQEVLLIGTLPVDLDGKSGGLLQKALQVLRPDIIMVEGTPTAGVSAMLMAGSWDLPGLKKPRDLDWTDIGDASAVEISQPEQKKRRWLNLISAPPTRPVIKSIVPVKVGYWAYHLRGSALRDSQLELQRKAKVA
eukprot:TRINITY_DN2113_c1_g1_i8.p1 TRINITY_DN2113_c1_g1~~TRINITY_DN2113_c1_g1_i8.p1  ORF type:complete len:199 (+),score=37.53 TRINITY_DN2113_c1_g1_i8:462-1058(+)